MKIKEFFRENEGKLKGNAVAFIFGAVFTGILGSLLGETVGYAALGAYFYGAIGQGLVAKLIEKRIKK